MGNAAIERAAKQAANKSPLALRLAEKLIDAGAMRTLDEGLELELAHLVEIFSDPTARSLLRARGAQQCAVGPCRGKSRKNCRIPPVELIVAA